jgi:tetratricopeptide (TPR) repeat protein
VAEPSGELASEQTQPEAPPAPEPTPEPEPEPKPEPPPPAIPKAELDAKLAEATDLVNRLKHADATTILDEILAKIPKEPRALALRALILLDKRKYEDALATANDCIEADTSQALCWITVAIVEQDVNKNLAPALAAYRKYLELEPDGRFAKSAKAQVERLSAKVEG